LNILNPAYTDNKMILDKIKKATEEMEEGVNILKLKHIFF